jgi:hypothetical protein
MDLSIKVYDIPDHLRGDTWDGITSISLSKNDVPLILTGAKVLLQFRKEVDSPVALELSTDNGGITITDDLNGIISVPPVLITMRYGIYQYDLQVVLADGYTKTYMKGSWKIIGDISHN